MNFRTVIAAMDLSSTDEQIVKFTSNLAPILGMKQLYFMHIVRDLTHPAHPNLEFHRLFSQDHPLDEKVKASLQKTVGRSFEHADAYGINVEVHEGKPYQKLLHWAEVKQSDLVLVGKKEKSEGSGITARRLAHRLTCSILFVPELAPKAIRRIVVPIDFSEHAAKALNVALATAKKIGPEVEVAAVNVIETMALNQFPGNFAYAETVEAFKTANQRAYHKMLDDNAINAGGLGVSYIEDPFENVAVQLNEYLKEHPADLVVMGAEGHSHFENFLFGSVTEQFVESCKNVPILVVR